MIKYRPIMILKIPDNNEWNVTTCIYESPNCFYYRKLKEIPL